MRRRDAQKHVHMCVLRHSGGCGRDKMATSSKENEEQRAREICIGPYQFEPIRENSGERRPEHPASSQLRSQISPETSVIYKFIFRNEIKICTQSSNNNYSLFIPVGNLVISVVV